MTGEAGTGQFESDLFISYAHIDDQPLPPDQEGWISRFHTTLKAFLEERLGRRVVIWRDPELQGNDVFGDEIVARLSNTGVLISIVTPRYLNSDWCTREIREFCEQADKRLGLRVANKARVFKVLKTPVEKQDSLPAVVRDLLGYEFFQWLKDGTPVEFDRAYGDTFGQAYNLKVAKLAWEIKELVEALAAGGGDGDRGADEKTSAKPAIYLAESSYDRREERESLEGELRRLGYTVLPTAELPRDETEYVDAVDGVLSRCRLAVHLIGESYGAVPDGPSERSTTEIQNELAVRRSKTAALRRVIWLREGTHSESPAQQAFVEALHTDPEAQFGADLITGDFEALKTAIFAALEHLEEETRPTQRATDGSGLIYLICTDKDRAATLSVRKYLHEQGFEVCMPAFDGDAAAIREVHTQSLTDCDAVVLFYGAGDEAWKRAMDNELRKTAGYRDGRPLLASFTYLAEPTTEDKEDLIALGAARLIDGLTGSAEAGLSTFVRTVSSSEAGR